MASRMTPSKRPFDRKPFEPNGRGKWQKTTARGAKQSHLNKKPNISVFRVLCPASKCDAVIGKDGSIVGKIQQETGAEVKLHETVPGCDERIISIIAIEKDKEVGSEQNNENQEGASGSAEGDNDKKSTGSKEEKGDSSALISSKAKKLTPSLLKALLLVFERVVANEHENDDSVQKSSIRQDEENHGSAEQKKEKSVSDVKKENDDGSVEKKEENDSLVQGKEENEDSVPDKEENEDSVPDKEEDGGSVSEKEENNSSVENKEDIDCSVEKKEENDGGDQSTENLASVSFRLLVLSTQVGCLLGKGGSIIKHMAADSGSQIQILSKDKLPLCASSPPDEIVQITGLIDSVRKGLQSVARQLLDNPPRDRVTSLAGANPFGSSSHSFAPNPWSDGPPPGPNFHLPNQGQPFNRGPFDVVDYRRNIASPFPNFSETLVPGLPQVFPELLTLRLLCPIEKAGSVIGKSGNVVKSIQHETGCEIKVLETVPATDDRIIAISGPAHPSDTISPAQNALLLVQRRIATGSSDDKQSPGTCRLVISSNQTGCLLGKGGGIIAEMRKMSGANIRLLSKDQLPKGVPENDEVVQIIGGSEATQEALMQITTRLRNHLFRDKMPGMNSSFRPPFDALDPPFGPFMGRHGSPPPRLHQNLPPFQKDFIGADKSAPWGPQGMREGCGPMSQPEFFGGPQRRVGGFSGSSQPAMIPTVTMDVVIPRSIVPSLYGEDGGCLRRIHEFSEAKITITEPRPEATETMILIFGTPEQTHAAQSLLQAFVLSETGAPGYVNR